MMEDKIINMEEIAGLKLFLLARDGSDWFVVMDAIGAVIHLHAGSRRIKAGPIAFAPEIRALEVSLMLLLLVFRYGSLCCENYTPSFEDIVLCIGVRTSWLSRK